MEYYSAMKKNEIMPFAATWMDLEIIILSEVSQKEKDKYHDITYRWNLQYDTNETIYEIKNRIMDIENRLMVAKGKRGKDWEFEVSRCKLLRIGWINKVLLHSTGTSI